jgi:uncharacterized protein (DUF305 family)
LLAATVILCFTPGLAMADDMGTMKMGTMKMDTEQTAGSPADKAFTQSMRKMMKNMDVKPTGKTDRDFVIMMMPHHQGAIDMAKVELKYGKDPMLLKLAADIVEAQEKEIAEMKAWLAGNGN